MEITCPLGIGGAETTNPTKLSALRTFEWPPDDTLVVGS